MAEKLEKLLQLIDGAKKVLIVTHDNPDPDALVSAFALCRLAEARPNAHARICYEGIVGRAENRVLAKELHIKPMSAARVNWDKWNVIALVDTQPGTGNNSFPARRKADIVIDHHPQRKKTRGKLLDIRPDFGASVTIMAEHLWSAGVAIDPDLAAAMCYAIDTETQDLAREVCPSDEKAYLRLYPLADKQMLARILHPRLPHEFYVEMARAVTHGFTYSNIIGAHLGEVLHPDSVSMVADYLLQHERMSWSIVTGVWKNALYVSLRTRSGRAHAGELLRSILKNIGRAGGHGTMAGGKVDYEGMSADKRKAMPEDVVQRLIQKLKRRKDVSLRPLVSEEEVNAGCKD